MTRIIGALALAACLCSPATVRADVVLNWNAIMVSTVAGQNPFAQGRFAAITQLAVFEAVNAVEGRYASYLGTPASPGVSAEAAAVAAAHTVLKTYFPAAGPTLDAARTASLANIPEGREKRKGILLGETVAAAMIAHRAADGAAPPAFHAPASADPGEWQVTPACPPAGGILAHWSGLTPFGILRADQFRSAPPPALSSRMYARDYDEVREVGDAASLARPQRKSDIARFYNVVLAVATWNPAVAQVAAARRTSLSQNARLFALLNMAISDGLVAVMETKYYYRLWRPETAIRAGDLDGNPKTASDPAFVPFLPTPCFPSYGSAHAAASNAARRVAEALLGDDRIDVTLTHPSLPGVVLQYDSFEEIADDIDDARVFAGIHFRFDQRAGARQGRQIGAWIYRHHLRPGRETDRAKDF
jgi:hypothetical protein